MAHIITDMPSTPEDERELRKVLASRVGFLLDPCRVSRMENREGLMCSREEEYSWCSPESADSLREVLQDLIDDPKSPVNDILEEQRAYPC